MRSIRIVVSVVLVLCLVTEVVNADFTFGEPTNLGPTVNTSYPEYSPCISADGLSLYFASWYGAYGIDDIFLSTRETTEDDWGPPVNLGPLVNSSAGEYHPSISTDALELYFERYYRDAEGNILGIEILTTKRATRSDPWDQPVKVDLAVGNGELAGAPSLSADGLELYFSACRFEDEPKARLCVTRRETRDALWGEPVSLGPIVNSWSSQVASRISSDGLLLLFCDWWGFDSPRPSGFGDVDMWFARRATKDGDWEEPVNLGPLVNTAFRDFLGMISPDGSTVYFSSTRPGGSGYYDLWQAPIEPVVDLNGDGIVDADDMCIIVDNWGTGNSLCDIGPMPWGDGVVDVQDLMVLAEHLFEEVPPVE